MKVIITGATGFIGKALCVEMASQGYEVIAVVRPNSKRSEQLLEVLKNTDIDINNRIHIEELELCELGQLSEKGYKADLFYHLAWNGSAGADRENFEIQYSNIAYTGEAIRTAVACGCKKFIGAGSQAEYGVAQGMAKEDETVPKPFMMYGAAKLASYQMGQVLAKQLGISFVWPRIYSVYGVGENPGTLVNYVIDTLQKGEVPQLSSCENMWNFMYITDCVRILRLLGEDVDTEGIYNVASNDTRLLKEFVEEIRDIVAPEVDLAFGAKVSDPARTFWLEPNVEKIEKLRLYKETFFKEGILKKYVRKKSRVELWNKKKD